jgi:hypothetical protein
MSWTAASLKIMQVNQGNVCGTVMRTTRDEDGVTYDVCIQLAVAPGAYEEGDDLRTVWTARVEFSHKASGGPEFVAMAREQERVAGEAWTRTR